MLLCYDILSLKVWLSAISVSFKLKIESYAIEILEKKLKFWNMHVFPHKLCMGICIDHQLPLSHYVTDYIEQFDL